MQRWLSTTAELVLIWFSLLFTAAAQEEVRFDFETGDLQGWKVVEGQFDYLISDRAEYHNAYPERIYNKQGKYYLSTVEQQPGKPSNDRMTGVVESPVFRLSGPDLSLLIGSGTQTRAYVALCTLEGNEVLIARGKAQTEIMQRVTWKAPQLIGQLVFLRVVDRETGGWGHVTLDDFTAQGRLDAGATQQRWQSLEVRRARQRLDDTLREANLPGLRRAIADLTETFAARYPRGGEFAARLDQLEQRLGRSQPEQVPSLIRELETLRREALVANPLVSGQPILYVVRNQYKLGGHHAIDTLFHTGEINTNCFAGPGALKTIDLATGQTKTLVALAEGLVRDPEVHFDGQRIVCAIRRHVGEDYHIWELNADGTGLHPLTSAAGVCDFDPLYLPDDHIAFSSTREPKYNQCSRDIGANLFRMEPDGANILQIGKNNLFDNHGALLPDGRILYARWEYVDRNFGDAHGIWTVNPDGTNQAIYWGNNTAVPGAVYYPRSIPGTQQLLCVFGMHHHRLWGALAIVDRTRGLDGREPVVRTWPADVINQVRSGGAFDCDSLSSVYPKYECPWPLSDKYFLCSRMTLRPGQTWIETDARYGHEMGIYLVDVFGNELLLHYEEPGCYDPMPLAAQSRPPIIPMRRDFENQEGTFYIADVYRGTHLAGVPRGAVKRLRVVESPEKRHWSPGAWFGQGYTAPGMNWHSLENKRILGTVPVEADGSASFVVPAEKFVYFQLLDADGLMIQSMRSGTTVQSGERAACIGCHDERRTAPPGPSPKSLATREAAPQSGSGSHRAGESGGLPFAWRRAPSPLQDWYGPPREFGFLAEVQPVFDKRCLPCHDYGQDAGHKLNLAADRTLTFNTAYTELWRKGYLHCVGAGPAEIQPAYSWGARASRLIQTLLPSRSATVDPAAIIKGHEQLRLTAEEFDRIATWVDLNGVYYPTYASAYPDSLTGRVVLDHAQLARLSQLTGENFGAQRSFNGNRGPEVSLDRPELSPVLARFADKSDPRYREALAIIQAGQAQLAQRPRGDTLDFQPCEVDQRREAKYAQRRQVELRNRAALRAGQKVYDERP